MSFTEIPILDLSFARQEDTKPRFLTDLRDALLNVGFLYLKNTGIEQELYDEVCQEGIAFFDLPEEEKLRIEMRNQPSFLGYSRVSYSLFWTCFLKVTHGHETIRTSFPRSSCCIVITNIRETCEWARPVPPRPWFLSFIMIAATPRKLLFISIAICSRVTLTIVSAWK